MRHTTRRHTSIALSSVAALAMSAPALGQHALDANLSATQGRINPRANGIEQQIRYNNAVINGSAPNGQSFRGSVGYGATDQFGGSNPGDTLYNFRRDSFTSGLAAGGVRGSDALRYQFSLATGQSVPSFMAGRSWSVERSGSVSRISSGASGSALRSTSDFVASQSYRPTLVGVRHDDLGAEYVARASPLLGVAWVKTAESPLGAPPVNPGQPVTPGVSPVPAIPGVPAMDGGRSPAGTAATREPPRVLVNPFTGLETSTRAVGSVLERQGTAVDLRVTGPGVPAVTSIHNQLETRFHEGYTQPRTRPSGGTDATNIPEPVSFEMQMNRLHRLLEGKPDPSAIDKSPPRATDGSPLLPSPVAPKAGDKPRNGDAGASTPPVPGVKATPVDQNAKALDALNAMTPEFLRGLKKVQEKKVDHYVEPAPAVGPDISVDPEAYRILMREGEALMAAGKYFDAEDHFVRAIAGAPRDPMARAARLHAQLGAGLYLSAAANLRALLAAHPELASTRYADALLPGAERCKTIAEQLAEQQKKYDSALGRESALLLAYLGYQRTEPKLVADGLSDFEKRIAPGPDGNIDRTLLTLVRAAWTTK